MSHIFWLYHIFYEESGNKKQSDRYLNQSNKKTRATYILQKIGVHEYKCQKIGPTLMDTRYVKSLKFKVLWRGNKTKQ